MSDDAAYNEPVRRRVHLGVCLAVAALVGAAPEARADPSAAATPPPPAAMPTPLDGLGPDLADAFTGYNLLLYGGAVAATGVMAFGGLDQDVRVDVQQHLVAPAYGDASFYAGYLVPALVAPGVYVVGLLAHDRRVTGAGSAALQALGVALLTMSVLKIGTGRAYPTNGGDPSAPDRLDHPDYAHSFRPFQTLWPLPAWPSGHTLGTISVAAALTGYLPDQWWIPALGYPLGLAIGFGMIVGDSHWGSDVVAGALIGHAIGYSIGRSFRLRERGEVARATDLQVVPILGAGWVGFGVGGRI